MFKMLKNNSWINFYFTKNKRLQSLEMEIRFLGKVGRKSQNYQFKLKFCT